MDVTRPLGIRTASRYRVVDEARVVEMLVLHAWAIEMRSGRRDYAEREAAVALDRWVAMGLGCERGADGVRRFDIAEVMNFGKSIAHRRGDPYYDRCVAQSRALILAFHPEGASPDAPPAPDTLPPARFTATLRREFELSRATPGSRVLLRLPLPIEDAALRDVRFDPILPPGADSEWSVAPGRLDVRVVAPRDSTIEVGVCIKFLSDPANAHRGPLDLTDADRELYTRPNEGVVKVGARIRALAAELAADERDPFTVVKGYVDFLIERFRFGVIHYDELEPAAPTDWPLDSGWFDCQLGSALLIALCRARGIPARLVAGYILVPITPCSHYWAEVWLDGRGWMPVDINVCDLSVRGRDRAWRDYYVGKLDYRMKTQILPRIFNLAPSVRMPPVWHVVARFEGDGTEGGVYADADGALVFRDRLVVQREGGPPDPGSVNAAPL